MPATSGSPAAAVSHPPSVYTSGVRVAADTLPDGPVRAGL